MKNVFATLSLLWCATASGANLPNVVLMMADDLGWADVEFNGGKTIRTPELSAMAANGIVFERFYSAAPVCSPTRGSMLTGRHPYRLGIPFANSGFLKPQELTLAEMLRAKGYRTGHFGKWHLGTLTKTEKDGNRGGQKGIQFFSPPQVNGFDVCLSAESKLPTWDPLWKPVGKASSKGWNAMKNPDREGELYGTALWNEKGERVTENTLGCASRVIADRAEALIRSSVRDKKPFFAVVWFHAPHLPVVAGPEYFAMYPDAESDFHRNYYGCVTALDTQVGRIRKLLRELGVAENTLVTFCSDNGPEGKGPGPGVAKPFRGRKRSLLEGGVRVPGVMEWPARIKAGTRTKFAAVTSDLMPTIAEVVGADMSVRPVDGASLLAVFAGEVEERAKPLGFATRGQATWHEGRFKIYQGGKSKKWALYDLEADPVESNDLSADQPDKVKAMAENHAEWMQSCENSNNGEDYK